MFPRILEACKICVTQQKPLSMSLKQDALRVLQDLQPAVDIKLKDGLRGVVVTDTYPNSADLRAGDVIVAFNGTQVNDARNFASLVDRSCAGDLVTLSVLRGRDEISTSMRIGASDKPLKEIDAIKTALESFNINTAVKEGEAKMMQQKSSPQQTKTLDEASASDRLRTLLKQALSSEGVGIEDDFTIQGIIMSDSYATDRELELLKTAYSELGPLGHLLRLQRNLEKSLKNTAKTGASNFNSQSPENVELAIRLSNFNSANSTGNGRLDQLIADYKQIQSNDFVERMKHAAKTGLKGLKLTLQDQKQLNLCRNVLLGVGSTGDKDLDKQVKNDKSLASLVTSVCEQQESNKLKQVLQRYLVEQEVALHASDFEQKQNEVTTFLNQNPECSNDNQLLSRYRELQEQLTAASKLLVESIAKRAPSTSELPDFTENISFPVKDVTDCQSRLKQSHAALNKFVSTHPKYSSIPLQLKQFKFLQDEVASASKALSGNVLVILLILVCTFCC